MKICLSSRQQEEYLKKADEIKFEYRDRKAIPDFFEKYPEATIILQVLYYDEIDEKEIELFSNLSQGKFMMAVSNAEQIKWCNSKKIPCYLGFPVGSFYELNVLKDLGVSYVRLGHPLFFEMDAVKKVGIPVRAVPNIAYNDGYSRTDGVCGTWIRPEDLELYDNYIDTIEFEDCDLRKERALYRIYMEDKRWPGELGLIISNLNYIALNRLITPEFAAARLNCGQKCQKNHHCKICYRALDLADEDKIKEYLQFIEKN